MFLFFEVMDKEPALSALWAIFLTAAVVGFVASYWKWPLAIVSTLLAGLLAWFFLEEFHDPFIKPSIWSEAPMFLPQFYFMAVIALALPWVGALIGLRRSKAGGLPK